MSKEVQHHIKQKTWISAWSSRAWRTIRGIVTIRGGGATQERNLLMGIRAITRAALIGMEIINILPRAQAVIPRVLVNLSPHLGVGVGYGSRKQWLLVGAGSGHSSYQQLVLHAADSSTPAPIRMALTIPTEHSPPRKAQNIRLLSPPKPFVGCCLSPPLETGQEPHEMGQGPLWTKGIWLCPGRMLLGGSRSEDAASVPLQRSPHRINEALFSLSLPAIHQFYC